MASRSRTLFSSREPGKLGLIAGWKTCSNKIWHVYQSFCEIFQYISKLSGDLSNSIIIQALAQWGRKVGGREARRWSRSSLASVFRRSSSLTESLKQAIDPMASQLLSQFTFLLYNRTRKLTLHPFLRLRKAEKCLLIGLQSYNLIFFIVFLTGKAFFHTDVVSSLKPLSQTYCGPTRSHFLDK